MPLDVGKTLRKTWADAVVVGTVVGEAKELRPLIEKHFPQYRSIAIPYRDTIRASTYE